MIAAGFADNFAHGLDRLWNFFATGGWFIFPIVLCWIVSVFVIIFKCLDLRKSGIQPAAVVTDLENLDSLLGAGKFSAFQTRLRGSDSVLARICRAALSGRHPDKESAARAAEATAREEVSRMERGISVLEIIFTISPMLGLIGTVSGLVRIFSSFGTAARDAAQGQEIALGIAEAMNTTIAGLVVAVPALIAQVLFTRHVERHALRMGTLVNDMIDTCWQYFHAAPETGGLRTPPPALRPAGAPEVPA